MVKAKLPYFFAQNQAYRAKSRTRIIAMQRPDATLVAGYRAWQDKFGRQVRKGERGMRILSPVVVKAKGEGDDGATSELRLAKETAKELRLLPDAARARPRTAMDQYARQRQRADASARAGEQAARQRQIQQEQQRSDRNRRAR